MFKGFPSPNRLKDNDKDIEHLKKLINKLVIQTSSQQPSPNTTSNNEKIVQIQQQNHELRQKIEKLTSQNKKIIRELLMQRQENTRLKNYIAENNIKERVSFEKSQKNLSAQKPISNLSPNQKISKGDLIRPVQSSPLKLVSFNENSSINRDQLYRLNSNLIEYNTNIKLLIEKYNYLQKLRGLAFPNEVEELKVINNANKIFTNRKSIEQAQSILQSSRKKYFGSDSSSDIEEQLNQIQEGT